MIAHDPALRPVRLPPADFRDVRVPITRQKRRLWYRVHQSTYPARFFSLNASHRFSHPECPFEFLYLGGDPATCLFERFGDIAYDRKLAIANSIWRAYSISSLEVPQITVCDLTNAKTLSALRVDLAALTNNDLKIAQAWGLAIQQHPANFEGIKFKSRFNNKVCLAVFRKQSLEERVEEKLLDSLPEADSAVNWLHHHKVSLY